MFFLTAENTNNEIYTKQIKRNYYDEENIFQKKNKTKQKKNKTNGIKYMKNHNQ